MRSAIRDQRLLVLACVLVALPLAAQAQVGLPAGTPARTMTIASHYTPPWPALEVHHPYYDTFLFLPGYAQGRFACMTGDAHPITNTVLPPGTTVSIGDVLRAEYPHNIWSVRSYASSTDYVLAPNMPWTTTEAGFSCVRLDDIASPSFEAIVAAGETVAVRESWLLDGVVDRLSIEQELRPVGESFASASLAVTLRVMNVGASEARVGARLILNPEIGVELGGTAGPLLGLRSAAATPEPLSGVERDLLLPDAIEWDAYGFRRPSRMHWLYHLGGSIVGPSTLSPTPTPPDRLQYTLASSIGGDGLIFACSGYEIQDPPRNVGSDFSGQDSGLAYYWGDSPERAIVLPPGATVELTTHVYAWIDYPITCAIDAPAGLECAGPETEIPLDGGGSAAIDGTPLRLTWSSPDPALAFDDAHAVRAVARAPGPGVYAIRLLAEVGPYSQESWTTVRIEDSVPPDLTAPAVVEARTSSMLPAACGAWAEVRAAATDACAGTNVTITNDHDGGGAEASGVFPVGETIVTFMAVDPSGNAAETRTRVRVIDDTPPVFRVTAAEPGTLWPPNHRLRDVTIRAEAEDNCDPTPVVEIVGVESSEPEDGLGDGDAAPDWELVPADPLRVRLRAERSGLGPGRVYTVHLQARDRDGNVIRAAVSVVVAHDSRSLSRPGHGRRARH